MLKLHVSDRMAAFRQEILSGNMFCSCKKKKCPEKKSGIKVYHKPWIIGAVFCINDETLAVFHETLSNFDWVQPTVFKFSKEMAEM